jgi:two-component system, cell cycle sensor histidine kinase and response regulator CckA
MFDSCVNIDPQQPLNIIDDQFLSVITTLFIEGMAMEQKSLPSSKSWNHFDHPLKLRKKTSIAPLPCSKQTEAIALKEYGTRKVEPHNLMRRSSKAVAGANTRTFILGLSDAFNNLLMGIWGNLSLINLTGDKSSSVFQRVAEMEHMIQNGSALLNAVFGYLGERRIVAKNIRLNQLIQEINGILPVDGDRIKNDILHASLTVPAAQDSVATLASNLSRMLKQFVERLQHQCDLILTERKLSKGVLARLHTVERLMARASEILTLLNCYAGVEPLDIKKISAKVVVSGLARKFETRFPYLEISLDLARRLPWIHADRSTLQFVLNQLMENAAGAMSGRGRLNIEASDLKADPARNRCVAHRWSDSIVITVSDTGYGMDMKTLLHVFDPFYSSRRNSSRLGMGLAASWGIVKAHGGYMHFRSKLGSGSTCKLYLPVGH